MLQILTCSVSFRFPVDIFFAWRPKGSLELAHVSYDFNGWQLSFDACVCLKSVVYL